MSEGSANSRRARWSLALLLVPLASVGSWYAFAPRAERASVDERSIKEAAPDQAPEPVLPPAAPAPDPVALAHALPVAPRSRSDDSSATPSDLWVVGPGPNDPHEPGMVPHPLDQAHARIDAENRLLQALNDAMSFRKVLAMREMLVEYKKLDPDDADAMQLGYHVIADCIEFRGEASLARAREFYATQRHSPLRRFVRRICFENSN